MCSECGKGFKSASDLKYHGVVHTEKTIKCPDCPLVFLNKTKMSYHRETHMDNKFKCNLCSTILGTRVTLAKHISKLYFAHLIALHSISSICTFNDHFIFWNILGHKHQMIEADKKYACTFCSFRFGNSDKLRTHMRSHTGEKRNTIYCIYFIFFSKFIENSFFLCFPKICLFVAYVCEYCDRRYAYQQDFKKHLRIHVGDNIYKCETCGKGFLLHQHLKEHLLEHYKENQLKEESKEMQKA